MKKMRERERERERRGNLNDGLTAHQIGGNFNGFRVSCYASVRRPRNKKLI